MTVSSRHYPSHVFYFKQAVSETEISLRLQVEPTQFGSIEEVVTETILRNRVLQIKYRVVNNI
jgi:hypothetical protein